MHVTVAGNTVMQHIAVGLPPDTIGFNPFIPLSLFGDEREIEGLGSCYFARCIASYVGGDITAGMLACELDAGGTRLFLDLGCELLFAKALMLTITPIVSIPPPAIESQTESVHSPNQKPPNPTERRIPHRALAICLPKEV